MLRNVNDKGGTKFETCGLTSSKQTQWKPKLSFYYISTVTNLLGQMRIVGHTVDNATKLYTAEFKVSTTSPSEVSNAAVPVGASRAFVIWLGTATGDSMKYTLQPGSLSGSEATLVELVDNSTVGKQTKALISPGGGVTLTVTESPIIVLLGVTPQPETGPVPPIDAPIPFVCKRRDGSALGPGLYCDGNQTSPSGAYRVAALSLLCCRSPIHLQHSTYTTSFVEQVCPNGAGQQCPDGGLCQQTSDGVIQCKENPKSPCAGKRAGLYCADKASKPAKGWPDGYVVCPAGTSFFCRTETPHCVQNATRVACTAT